MEFKVLIEIEGRWMPFNWAELNETILFGNDLTSYKKRFWTGQKDKNGKDIYGGDIIKASVLIGEGFIIGQILIDERMIWVAEEINPVYREREYLFELTKFPGRVEIIGNIYENPELLNK